MRLLMIGPEYQQIVLKTEEAAAHFNTIPKLAETFGMTTDELMQIKTESARTEEKTEKENIVSLIFRAVCIAMGIAVTVLSLLGELDTNIAITMLGIGVACAGVSLLEKK